MSARGLTSGIQSSILFTSASSRPIQVIVLFGSMILAMGFGFVSSVLTTRVLGAIHFGDFAFVQTIWNVLSLLSTFGYLYSGSRVLVMEKDSSRVQELLGTIILLAAAMGVIIMGFTIVLAAPIDRLFDVQVADILIKLAPLVIAFPLRDALYLSLQSTSRVWLLAMLTCLPSLLYLIVLWILSGIMVLTTTIVLLVQQVTLLFALILCGICVRPRFREVRKWLRLIAVEHKTFGEPVYIGIVLGVVSGQLNRLAISYWVDNVSLGFYSLAIRLTDPLKMIPNAAGTVSFRDFAHQNSVPKRALGSTIGVSAIALVLTLILCGPPLSQVYPKDFSSVGPMAQIAAAGSVLFGLGDFYNRFLGAHGKGKALRNTAILVGVVNTIGFFGVVPLWGAWGAILVSVAVGITYLTAMIVNYIRHTRISAAESKMRESPQSA